MFDRGLKRPLPPRPGRPLGKLVLLTASPESIDEKVGSSNFGVAFTYS